MLALGLGITAALIALEHIRVTGTDWPLVAGGGLIAVALLGLGLWHLLRSPAPLVQLRVLRVPTLRVTVWRVAVSDGDHGGSVPAAAAVPIEFGWTPLAAGLMVAALFAGNLTIKPFTTPLMKRLGIRRVLLVNGLASVGCFGLLAVLATRAAGGVIALILYVSGALRSIGFTAYNSLAFSDVEGDDLTHANTLNARCRTRRRTRHRGRCPAPQPAGVLPAGGPGVGVLIALTLIETLRLPASRSACQRLTTPLGQSAEEIAIRPPSVISPQNRHVRGV